MRTRLILAGLLCSAVVAVAASPAKLSIIKKAKATPTPAPREAAAPAAMPAVATGAAGEHEKFFREKIAPVLAERCYKCHSVAEGKSKGGLTMDTAEALRKGGDTGPALKPGAPDESLLIQAIEYKDSDTQMPPSSTGGKLDDADIAAFREWVKMGAVDPRKPGEASVARKLSGLSDKARAHWAYVPLKRPAVPQVRNASWGFTPIDSFIMAKIEEKKLVASPLTDKETLMRRAYFDLIGLPPTPAEIDTFIKDESTGAFAKIVERLLASPHYGERWGRYWLDTARYSDTVGGDQNNNTQDDYRYPYAWTYRDWVINAMNADLPYDQFIMNQLAADQMPGNDKKNLAALGLMTVGERFRQNDDTINDRIDVVTKGFLGMTVSCARCHDHMFDPIPQKDYYALKGIFSSIDEPDAEYQPVLNSPDLARFKDYQDKIAQYEEEDRKTFFDVLGEGSRQFRESARGYLQAAYLGRRGSDEAALKQRDAIIEAGKLDGQVANFVSGRMANDERIFGPLRVFEKLPAADYATQGAVRAQEIAANKGANYNPLVAVAFKGFKPANLEDVFALYGKLFGDFNLKAEAAFATARAAKSADSKVDRDSLELAGAIFRAFTAAELNTEMMKALIDQWPLRMRGRGRYNFAAINELTMTHDGAPAKAMVVKDKSSARDVPLLIRGQAGAPGEVVPRGFLEVLSPGGQRLSFSKGSGRLELAQAIASKDNATVARVLVNRVWAHHFGDGFVPTLDDIGVQSEKPSHLDLVNYLADWFVTDGKWSVKQLHRYIMLSKVYQIRSYAVKSNEDIDPDNRYLWRANVRRLNFEAMRDSMLVMSGRLEPQVGGSPVNLTDEPYSYRRSIYGYIDRGNLPDLMAHFDFSDPHMTNSKRTSTIVPQQALFLMNSPFAIDVARRIIARKEVVNQPNDVQRVQAIYKIIFSRLPKGNEVRMAFDFLGDETMGGKQIATAAAQLAEQSNKKLEELKKRAESPGNMRNARRSAITNEGDWVERKPLTAWETYAQTLLLSNEAVYVN
ncbi:MAG: PSD1 and planctomycete cytochrome C domain-containing protein [Chthoniobacteraceae bacterium]